MQEALILCFWFTADIKLYVVTEPQRGDGEIELCFEILNPAV